MRTLMRNSDKPQQRSGLQRPRHQRKTERKTERKTVASDDLLSASEAATILGVSTRAFRNYVAQRTITPHSKTPGGHLRFRHKRERVEELNLEFQEKKAELALQQLEDEQLERDAQIQAQEEQAQQDADAAEERRGREIRQARAAVRAKQARQDWEAEWLREMLKSLPRDLPAQLRLEVIQVLQQNLPKLYDNHAGHAEDVVFTLLRAQGDEVMAPWIHSRAVARAAEEAIKELPIGATSSTWNEVSEWERRAREEALAAIADLPDGATVGQLEDAARAAGRQVALAYNHQETADTVIADLTWSLPGRLAFSSPQARAQATQAVRAAIAEVPIGASRAELEEARDAALAPFAAADAQTRTEREAQHANVRRQVEAQQAIATREAEAKKHLERVFYFLAELQADPNGVDFGEGKLYQYAKQIAEEIKPELLEDLPLDFLAGRHRVEELVNEWVASHCS